MILIFYKKSTVDSQLALKRNISDSYNKNEVDNLFNNYYNTTYIDTNYYDKTYINTNYYDKTYIDNLPTGGGGGGGGDQHRTKTAIVEFTNVDNISNLDTLKIIGGVNIWISDDSNNYLMDLSQYQVQIHPPLICYSTAQIVGNLTAPNIYNKTEVNNLLDQ